MSQAASTSVYALPDGYQMRATVPDDAEALARIYTESARMRGEHEMVTADDVRDRWRHPDFDLAKSSRVVFDSTGQVIGVGTVGDVISKPVHPFVGWAVLPVPERHQIALVLIQWADERAKQVIERCPPEARISWRTGVLAGFAPDVAIMTALNLTPIRYFNRMLLKMQTAPEVRALPDGISLCAYHHPDELLRVVQAVDEAWHDHFGYVERPVEEMLAAWQRGIDSDKLFDPSLWFLAVEDATGEIAGIVMARIEEHGNPDVSYIELVATRRPWRGRGIAPVLLLQAFGELWRRGRQSVALFVDDSSPTGANRLYERIGMHIDHQYIQYEKELRPGVELANQ